jgi:hypothetical protein
MKLEMLKCGLPTLIRFSPTLKLSFDTLKIVEKTLTESIDTYSLEYYENVIKNYGVKPPAEWKCFELADVPGLYAIENPFYCQRYLVKKSLSDYPNKPNKTNLDLHQERGLDDSLWSRCIK